MNGWKPEASKGHPEREGVEVIEEEKDREAFGEWIWQEDADAEAVERYIDRTSFQAHVNALQGAMEGALLGDSGPVPYDALLTEKELWDFAALKLSREITEEEVERLISLYRLMIGRYHAGARPPEDPDREEDFLPSGAAGSELG
jgi:hypothetical protein